MNDRERPRLRVISSTEKAEWLVARKQPQPEKPRLWVVPRDVPRLAVVHPERPGAA